MKALITLIVTIGFQTLLAGARQLTPYEAWPNSCICHRYKPTASGAITLTFCGYELIEQLTAANQSTVNCKGDPDVRYICRGPYSRGYESRCPQETPICTPGGVAYYKVLSPDRIVPGIQYNSTKPRFCATHEGKANFEMTNNLIIIILFTIEIEIVNCSS